MSDELIDALRSAGAGNLETFEAVIEEVGTGRVHRGHKAVNVIGLVSCAGLGASDPTCLNPAIDSTRARPAALQAGGAPGAAPSLRGGRREPE